MAKLQIVLLIFGFARQIVCLESVFLKIPEQTVYAGDDVTIACHYNLEDDRLGSIKWYKDNELFMWYSPRDRVPIRGYPAVGVNLEEKLLRPYTITLKNVGVDSAGEYSCEVAAEAPSQQRQTATARLTVHGTDDEYDNLVGYRPVHTNDAHSTTSGKILIAFGFTTCVIVSVFQSNHY